MIEALVIFAVVLIFLFIVTVLVGFIDKAWSQWKQAQKRDYREF